MKIKRKKLNKGNLLLVIIFTAAAIVIARDMIYFTIHLFDSIQATWSGIFTFLTAAVFAGGIWEYFEDILNK